MSDMTLRQVLDGIVKAKESNNILEFSESKLAEEMIEYFTNLSNVGSDQLSDLHLDGKELVGLLSMILSHATITTADPKLMIMVASMPTDGLLMLIAYVLRIGIGMAVVEELR
jgi:hypothetical protein